ncbi:hydrogenase large subunit [Desulfovibrio cuneatus]|uniref:hydrogenase large subunit n=1 Tax=Desulfovibrio cuneatus TaxID=159728 RepID=UPI00040D8E17|nr:nickel-dependent hydrogenase large subunit [Desulfovibrio cuneatus]
MSEALGKEFTLPLGPMHVALEEPMYFKVTVEGERVRHVEITSGHVHRGMEALATKRNLFQNIVLTERVCSLCSNSHPLTYCMAIENLAGIEVPRRAQYLRVLADEIKRVASHLFNVAILAHIIGYKSLFMHVMEVREIMQDVKETVYGNRMDLAANTLGGVKNDVDAQLFGYITRSLQRLEGHMQEIIDIYASNPMLCSRTVGVGVLPKDEAIRYGLVGPVARGSGLAVDVRRDAPYGIYPELSFNVITETGGDVHSRAMVRLREVNESISLIRQIAANLPEGKLTAPLPVIPAGQGCARTEAPRGELFYFIRTDESDIPTRLKWRVPSYMNWDALEVMMKDCAVADVSLIVNSIDPCVSCTER